MFALEINFHDGVSQPEVILVRRPYAILGSSDYAHVVVEGSGGGLFELRLSRGVGREFRCQKLGRTEGSGHQHLGEGSYDGEAEIDLGDVSTHITALDSDLQLQQGESPDIAGLRILRRSLLKPSPEFPAVVMNGPTPVFVSFSPDEPVLVGRSRKCGLRLDASDVSAEHARFGCDSGKFWVEDLGSTNGTFVNGERVKGRRVLKALENVTVGGEYTFSGVNSLADVEDLAQRNQQLTYTATAQPEYPVLISKSDVLRPPRLVLAPGTRYKIGRDPACDIWVGAAHVSRNHAEIQLEAPGRITLIDLSSNGTKLNGVRLEHGVETELPDQRSEIDLGAGVSVIVARNQRDEEESSAKAITAPSAEMPSRLSNRASSRPSERLGDRGSEQPGAALASTMSAPVFRGGAESGAALKGATGTDEPATNGVFERLAQRAAAQGASPFSKNRSGGGDGYMRSAGSSLGQVGTSLPSSQAPQSSTSIMDLGDDESTLVSRFGRAVLAFAVTVLAIVLLFLVWWFLGNSG